MNNKEQGQKLVSVLKPKPRTGVYGDDSFYDSYVELVKALGELIPVDEGSAGNISHPERAAMARVRCENIVMKAKMMSSTMKAATAKR